MNTELMTNKKVLVFQAVFLAHNMICVWFLTFFIYRTSELIRARYDARAFLSVVQRIPRDPQANLYTCSILMILMAVTFLLRWFLLRRYQKLAVLTLLADVVISLMVLWILNFNYHALLLLVFAYLLIYVNNGRAKLLVMSGAVLAYLLTDFQIISIYMPLYNVTDYIQYYPQQIQQYLFGIYNVGISLNIIMFIIYCIYVINLQQGTIEEVNRLNEQLKEYAGVSERMAQTRERNRLAREIHDTLGHTLTGLTAGLDACLAMIDVAPEQTKKQLELLANVSRQGIKEVRRSVNELRPDALERLSLEVALEKMIMEMSHVSDVIIYFEKADIPLKFDADEEDTIYRTVQESITNAVRHGQAKHIWITIRRDAGEVVLTVRDDGRGCKDLKKGFGIRHMKERVEMLGGSVSYDGRKGFTVTACIPIRWGEQYD